MIGEVVVMRPDAFREWLASGEPGGEHRDYLPLAEHGSLVYQEHGCGACHGKRSTPMAPRLDGLYGRQSRLENGRLVTADANYIRESILRPGARIVAGYGPESSMPEYQGRIGDEDLVALVEFIRSIRDGWPEDTPAGEEATP
jgi:cytochrome c oxidase subunit 2